ncbi:26S proteasome regulatory subunit 8 [Gryllus bimaculatus]|nr:26S proteasome regulatory subunit 8 [Gryllus bimaculatus]
MVVSRGYLPKVWCVDVKSKSSAKPGNGGGEQTCIWPSMFTLQTHNQLSTALNSWRPNITPFASKKTSGLHNRHPTKFNVALCVDRFNEVLEIASDSIIFKELHNIKAVLFEKIVSWKFSVFQPHSIPEKAGYWNVSFVSSDTFAENKKGTSELSRTHLDNGSPTFSSHLFRRNIQKTLQETLLPYDIQIRGFKCGARLDQSPGYNLLETLKKYLRIPNTQPTTDPKLTTKTGTQTPETTSVDTERLKTLLNEESKNPEMQMRIKLAFAEGYLAGTGHSVQSRSMKFLKVFQQVLLIMLSVAIFISFLAIFSGSSFRLQLGNHVEVDPEDIHVTFNDVKGVDGAKEELRDVVEFLKFPEKFSVLGGKLPKGVLLVGPPGTGKTLLARAVAGEAGVPFFHAAGPEFDEILVGQGARRVRDLFKAAKENAPCVVFIDEIDSVGSKRTNSVLHPYANQTINQLLSEMDGFHQNEGVIVLGATNRRDDLDKALLRPGRFDLEITVPVPDYVGRKDILKLYLGRILCKNMDVELLARGTTGFTGADLENMVNQAALKAAIEGAEHVSMKHLDNARDKVLMGPERKSRIPDEEANTITAYHEGGHAIVAYYTKDSHPLHKVTIIPRGPSLGHTAYIPEKERYHVTKAQLLALMDTLMGGRAAEELVFGAEKITSGASSDLQQATAIATHMVKDWGMSERVGLRTYEPGNTRGWVQVGVRSQAQSL